MKLSAALTLAVLLTAGAATAQDYPSKPIRIIVPAAPGGIGDILPRMMAAKTDGKHTIIVENRAGSAGVIAAELVSGSPADGYTLLMANHGVLSIRPLLIKVPYDPVKDFTPVALMVSVPNILVVHPSVPAKNLKELIAYAKANPGKLTYASQGIGASGHIAGELFKLATGVDITHVPYKGAAPAGQDLLAGHVHMMFDVVSLAMGAIRNNQLRAIGVTVKERLSVLPDVPTLAEQGFPDEIDAWFGLVAPAGTPRTAIDWLNREVNRVFSLPDTRSRFINQGALMPLGSPEDFARYIASQTARYRDVIKSANIKAN